MSRKSYHWRFTDNPERISEWMDNQSNIGNSLSILVHHFIDKYGMENVTAYEIQKQLNNELIGNIENAATIENIETVPQYQNIEMNEDQHDKKDSGGSPKIDYSQLDIKNL